MNKETAVKIDESAQSRFSFGENWTRFLVMLDEDRVVEAEKSLKFMLMVDSLAGKKFLDIGSGSGLFSLAARRLGATVHSFDFDEQSVACTRELRRRYFPADESWVVEQASVLDRAAMRKMGRFDIVYSWGVLHHTGAMYVGIENAINCVMPDGIVYIAVYNDQGWKSHFWWFVKLTYSKLPWPMNRFYAYLIGGSALIANLIKYTARLKPMTAIRPLREYKNNRGMSFKHDMIDWIGGFPYEFARYDVLNQYFSARGFERINGKQVSSLGCHQAVYRKLSDDASS